MTAAVTDELLIERARKGDMSAFDELFNRYKKGLVNFVYRLIGNREAAEEVAQEAFVKVYTHLSDFDVTKKFLPWVFTIARNLSKNALRDRSRIRETSMEEAVYEDEDAVRIRDVIKDPGMTPDLIAEDNELNESAQKILNSLPLKYREVIDLCSIQELTYKEASGIIGCSMTTVMLRLNKAKELFLKKLHLDA